MFHFSQSFSGKGLKNIYNLNNLFCVHGQTKRNLYFLFVVHLSEGASMKTVLLTSPLCVPGLTRHYRSPLNHLHWADVVLPWPPWRRRWRRPSTAGAWTSPPWGPPRRCRRRGSGTGGSGPGSPAWSAPPAAGWVGRTPLPGAAGKKNASFSYKHDNVGFWTL